MYVTRPWHEGVPPAAQLLLERTFDRLTMLRIGELRRTPSAADEIVELCEYVLLFDPTLVDFVSYVHRVTHAEAVRDFCANGASAKARWWGELGDRVQPLMRMQVP